MLTQVHFENIKALANVTVDLSPFTLLVGPNGCGKSTLLDQVDLLCRMFSSHDSNAVSHIVRSSGGPAKLRTHGQTEPLTWACSAERSRMIRIEMQAPMTANVPKQVRLDVGGGTTTWKLAVSELSRLTERSLRLSLNPQVESWQSPRSEGSVAIEADGGGVVEMLAEFGLNNPDGYRALQDDLRHVVPHFRRLQIKQVRGTIPDADNQLHTTVFFNLYLELVGSGLIPMDQASEGTLLALGLLAALHVDSQPDVVLIDDLDRGLHIGAQHQVIQAIRRIQARRPNLQVIATSHAPLMVDGLQPEEVRVMALDAQGHAHVQPLTAHPELERYRGALQTGELWASFGEDWVLQAPTP